MPSVALREIDELPMGLLEAIVTYRGYRTLKQELEAAERRNDSDAASDKRFDLVNEIQFALVEERKAQQERDQPRVVHE